MKDWLHTIGEWVVINNEIKSASPGDVGRLAYIKELLTSGEYDYRVATDKNGLINVKEKELNNIPQDKLDRYLDIMKWSYAKYPGNGFKFKIHSKDYLNELLELEDAAGDKDWIPFSGLVDGDESEDEIMSEKKVEYVVDNVNSPNHYTQGGIESIDYMKAKLSDEAFQGFLHGNVLKYISRSNYKNGVEDLKKAQWYLNRLVSEIEGK